MSILFDAFLTSLSLSLLFHYIYLYVLYSYYCMPEEILSQDLIYLSLPLLKYNQVVPEIDPSLYLAISEKKDENFFLRKISKHLRCFFNTHILQLKHIFFEL